MPPLANATKALRSISARLESATKRAPIPAYLAQERVPLLFIAGFFLLSCLLISPLKNVAIIDDWTYAWSVENFLNTGRLAVLDWSAHYPIFQTLWGSLFSRLFGFSFGVLRISTVVLAVIGCMALYLTLRELELDRWASLLGALALAVNPIFFVLSFSFMTDVPFLSMMNLATFCYVAGIKRDRATLLWIGGLFAIASFLSRQIGLVIPLALAPCLLQRGGGGRRFLKRLLPLLASLAAIGLLWWLEVKWLGRTSVMQEKMEALDYLFPIDFKHVAKESVEDIALTAFWVFPLLIGGISFKPKWHPLIVALVAVGSALLMHWWFHKIIYPLDSEGTWNVDELGSARGLMHGSGWERGSLRLVTEPLRWLMVFSWAILVAGLFRLLVTRRLKLNKIRDWISSPAAIIIAMGLLHLALINALWFYDERYYIVLIPVVVYLSLRVSIGNRLTRALALSGIAMFAIVSITGTLDMLRFDQAAWDAYNSLRAAGVPASDIDAGYAINGWMLYAHPQNLPPGSDPTKDVPYITGDEDLPYKISTSPPSADDDYETVREIPLRMPFWSVTNKLYILHKPESQSDEEP